MDGAGDQLLARAGFAGDQHRGVGRGDAADVGEHLHQAGAPADNLLEIMKRSDFFLKVEVMLLEASAFALGQHAVGDVHKERSAGQDGAVVAAAGLHPHIDPQRSAVLPA